MGSALELWAPTGNELSVGIENDHGVVAQAVLVHRVVNIDEALRVFADTVGVAISDLRRQFTPVVDHFVYVITAPDCGICAASLVGSCKHGRIHFRKNFYVGASSRSYGNATNASARAGR